MSEAEIKAIGFCAAFLTTFGFVPQFIKLIKTKQTEGLSLLMMIQISCGLLLWLIYGILRKDIVLIAANGIGLVIMLSTIAIFLLIRGKIWS